MQVERSRKKVEDNDQGKKKKKEKKKEEEEGNSLKGRERWDIGASLRGGWDD